MEVKYRAWDKINNAMYIVMSLVRSEQGSFCLCRLHIENVSIAIPTKNLIFLQYSGLKDSTRWEALTEEERFQWTRKYMPSEWKGREIYEGDRICIKVNNKYIDYIAKFPFTELYEAQAVCCIEESIYGNPELN